MNRVVCKGGCGRMVIPDKTATVYRKSYEFDTKLERLIAKFTRDDRIDGLCRKCRREIEHNQRKQGRKVARQRAARMKA